jgi:hypothetical protein
MNRFYFFVVLLGSIYWYRSDSNEPVLSAAQETETSLHTISIKGNTSYVQQVNLCLDTLASRSKQDYDFVVEHIGIISQNSRSGMNAWENPPRYDMSDQTAFASASWCASTIAHDVYHSFLYIKHRTSPSKRTEYDLWGGFDAEREAIAYQLQTALRIGSPPHEIDYLKSLDGTHGDVNGDGKLTSEDYKARNW